MAGRGGANGANGANGAQQRASSSSMAEPLNRGGSQTGKVGYVPSTRDGEYFIACSSMGSSEEVAQLPSLEVAQLPSRSISIEGARLPSRSISIEEARLPSKSISSEESPVAASRSQQRPMAPLPSSGSSSCCSLPGAHCALVAAALLGPAAICAAAGLALGWGWRHDRMHQLMGAAALLSLLLLGLLYCRARRQRGNAAGAREVELEMGSMGSSIRPVELGPADVVREARIGGGKYGDVFRGRLVRTGETVAVKSMKQGQEVTQRQINDLKEEIQIMKQVADHGSHANIVGVRGYMLGNDPLLVLELAVHGSLHDRLLQMKERREEIKSHVVADYCLQIALGMRYVEGCWVVHRDLAARNVLVAANEVLKISDFGLARGVSHGFLTTGGYQANIHRQSNNWAWRWTAPEGLIEQKFTTKGDVWSFGIVVTEICSTGDRPYHPRFSRADLEFIDWLERGGRITRGANWPEDIYALARKCWKIEPKHRPSFKEIVKTLRKRGSRWLWG